MKTPKVTIITIVWNLIKNGREEVFRQCMESVHSQTYKNIEHLIIDGASSDGTLDIIQEYVDKGWAKCFSEPDTGIYNAFNNGIKHATGKYIAFLNSDDFYSVDNAVELSVRALEKTNADFSCATCNILRQDGTVREIFYPKIWSFIARMPFPHETMFAKKELFETFGGFDETFRIAGDYNLIYQALLAGKKYAVLNKNILNFRLGGESDVHIKTTNDECIRIIEQNLGLDYESAARLRETEFADRKILAVIFKNKNCKIHPLLKLRMRLMCLPHQIHEFRRKSFTIHIRKGRLTEVLLFGITFFKKDI